MRDSCINQRYQFLFAYSFLTLNFFRNINKLKHVMSIKKCFDLFSMNLHILESVRLILSHWHTCFENHISNLFSVNLKQVFDRIQYLLGLNLNNLILYFWLLLINLIIFWMMRPLSSLRILVTIVVDILDIPLNHPLLPVTCS